MALFIGMIAVGVIWLIYMLLQDHSTRALILAKYRAIIKPPLKPVSIPQQTNRPDMPSASLLGKAKSVTTIIEQNPNTEGDGSNNSDSVPAPTDTSGEDTKNELVDSDEPSFGYSPPAQTGSVNSEADTTKEHDLINTSEGVQYGGLQQQVGDEEEELPAYNDDSNEEIEESLVPADVLDGEAQVYETYDLQDEASFAPGVPLDDYWNNLTTVQTSLENIGRSALRRASKQAVTDRCLLFLEIAENYRLVNDANLVAAVEKKADEFKETEYANMFFAVVQAATEGVDNFELAQMGLEAMAE